MAYNAGAVFRAREGDPDPLRLMRLGFNDAARRRGFADAYDVWDEIDQRNYELGRMMACLARRGLKDRRRNPTWPEGERGGAMLRRYLGEEAGKQAVIDLNKFIARDAHKEPWR